MPKKIVLTSSYAMTAATPVDNVLTGTKVENIPNDDNYRVRLSATSSVADTKHQLDADTDSLLQSSLASSQNRVPLVPDDYVGSWDVKGGSKLFLSLDPASTGTYFFTIELIPFSILRAGG